MSRAQELLADDGPLPPIAIKFAKYFLTGGFAAIVDIGGFAALVAFGVAAVASAICSYLAAAVLNYLLTSYFIYAAAPSLRGYLRFLSFALLGLCVNVAVTLTLLNLLAVPPIIAKTSGVGVAFVANFLMVHFFVFQDHKD